MNRIVEVHVAAVFTGVKREEAKMAYEDAELDHMRELQRSAEENAIRKKFPTSRRPKTVSPKSRQLMAC